jgi:hypothetical protein
MYSDGTGRWNSSVIAPWKVNPNQPVTGVCTEACACAAFARAEDATKGPSKGPIPPGRYRHYYYNTNDDIVCSTGSSCEGEVDPLDPPADPDEDVWVAWYYGGGLLGWSVPSKRFPRTKRGLCTSQPDTRSGHKASSRLQGNTVQLCSSGIR